MVISDQSYLDHVLQEGVEKADSIASKKIRRMKDIIGF